MIRSFPVLCLAVALAALFPSQSYAKEGAPGLSSVTVKAFHEMCMGNLLDNVSAKVTLTRLPAAPEDKAKGYRAMVGASEKSDVRSYPFGKANIIIVYDAEKKNCALATDQEVDFKLVEDEFEARTTLYKSSMTIIKGKNVTGQNDGLNYEYVELKKKIALKITALVGKTPPKAGQVGALYTINATQMGPKATK